MRILITAGATSESIDKVRSITNLSTGRLGSMVAEEYEKFADIEEIYYVCGKSSVLPTSNKVKVMYISDVSSLQDTIVEMSKNHKIDIVVHTMAVSDYKVKSITSRETMLNLMYERKKDLVTSIEEGNLKEFINDILEDAKIASDAKINSEVENMLLITEKTPKVISHLRELFPDSIIVGFKLLYHVALDILIDTGFTLLQKNKCDFVLANDLETIKDNEHIGYLIDCDKKYAKYKTKQEIAKNIAKITIEKRSGSS